VGYYTFGIEKRTLVEHWNGSEWSIVPSPNTDKRINVLNGMVAISPSNVWAVGSATSDGLDQTTLILQCPGTAGLNTLYAVAANSANDVWAVGGILGQCCVWVFYPNRALERLNMERGRQPQPPRRQFPAGCIRDCPE
jgi:hypothetical protein